MRRRLAGASAGFSMTETLIALGIFAVGFAAVAAIFPVATVLQKETADDVLAQQVARNVKALMRARKFMHEDLTDPTNLRFIPEDLLVHPALSGDVLAPGWFGPGNFERWKLNDRSYFFVPGGFPANYYHPSLGAEEVPAGAAATESNRAYYWVPLLRRVQIPTGPEDWQVFVFILRGGNASDPIYGYNRIGINTNPWDDNEAGGRWANYDGQVNLGLALGWRWDVPAVYGMPVTVPAVTPRDRFHFPDWNQNLYGLEASSTTRSSAEYEVQVGDQVLDNNGNIYVVATADAIGVNVDREIPTVPSAPNILWYGRPASEGAPSPTKLIIAVGGAVE